MAVRDPLELFGRERLFGLLRVDQEHVPHRTLLLIALGNSATLWFPESAGCAAGNVQPSRRATGVRRGVRKRDATWNVSGNDRRVPSESFPRSLRALPRAAPTMCPMVVRSVAPAPAPEFSQNGRRLYRRGRRPTPGNFHRRVPTSCSL